MKRDCVSGLVAYDFPLAPHPGFLGHRKLIRLIEQATGNELLYRIGPFWACESPESHAGSTRWAIDFLVPDGTPVFAAADGTIVAIKNDSNEWGSDRSFEHKANYVVVMHGSEFSMYCHIALSCKGLLKRSVSLRVGQQVKRGQKIAYVQKNGWTDRDHLHFMVFKQDAQEKDGFRSLRVADQWSEGMVLTKSKL